MIKIKYNFATAGKDSLNFAARSIQHIAAATYIPALLPYLIVPMATIQHDQLLMEDLYITWIVVTHPFFFLIIWYYKD